MRGGDNAVVFDKRGAGGSQGPGVNAVFVSIEDQARDAAQILTMLSARADVRATRIGLWGFSQGSWVTLRTSQLWPKVEFVMLVSGSAFSPLTQNSQWWEQELVERDAPPDQRQAASAYLRDLANAIVNGESLQAVRQLIARSLAQPWGQRILQRPSTQWELSWWKENEYDPANAIRALRVPTLVVLGARDLRVPSARNIPRFANLLVGNSDVQLTTVPAASHTMNMVSTGLVDEQIPTPIYSTDYFAIMTSWLARRHRSGGGSE